MSIMKLYSRILTIILVSLMLSCGNTIPSEKNGFTTITGVFDMPDITEVILSKVEHGKSFVVGTSTLNNEKQFGFSIHPDKEGFFLLSDNDRNNIIPIYIKGNQTFKMQYDEKGYKLPNIPDAENEVLFNWVKSIDTLETFNFKKKHTTYNDFFPFYEKFIPEMKKYHELVNTENENFNKLMHAYIDFKIEDVALNFIFTPRSVHPEEKDMPSFYQDFMKGENFKSDIILNIPNGIATLRTHQQYKYTRKAKEAKNLDYRTEMFKNIENDNLRGHLVLEFLNRFKSYDSDYLNFIEPLRKDIELSEYVMSQVDGHEVKIKSTAAGTQGYPFTYKNETGVDVSFSDFKGNYVYIDVWATWCAPCKQEIPYIKQLEKDLQGKNIQFVSISMDKPKDHEKWKMFVKDESLVGVQLFSDNAFDTRFAKDYKINAIPRFLLFDDEGKIVDANAKRPSNPELKKQLLDLLN